MTTMKSWRMTEAARCGVGEAAIATRLSRGQYPKMKVKRVNARRIFVLMAGEPTTQPHRRLAASGAQRDNPAPMASKTTKTRQIER